MSVSSSAMVFGPTQASLVVTPTDTEGTPSASVGGHRHQPSDLAALRSVPGRPAPGVTNAGVPTWDRAPHRNGVARPHAAVAYPSARRIHERGWPPRLFPGSSAAPPPPRSGNP